MMYLSYCVKGNDIIYTVSYNDRTGGKGFNSIGGCTVVVDMDPGYIFSYEGDTLHCIDQFCSLLRALDF